MALWTPALIDTALWLDASDSSTITESGGAVSAWADKSGNNHHATATSAQEPTYNSTTDRIEFDGTELMTLPNSLASCNAVSVFFVANASAISGGNSIGYVLFAKGTGDTRFYVGALNSAVGSPLIYTAGAILSDVSPAYTNGTDYMAGGVWGSNICNFYLDADNIHSGTETATATITDWRLGGTTSTPTLVGNIAEVIICDYAVDAETRQRIDGYLAWKWGLESNLPTGHPYELAAPADFLVSGIITDDTGTPCARTVRLYDRATGAFIAETTSDASTGAYDFSDMVSDSEVQRIVLDDSAGTLYNDLIDRVIPG